jgi:hypothetical protein
LLEKHGNAIREKGILVISDANVWLLFVKFYMHVCALTEEKTFGSPLIFVL